MDEVGRSMLPLGFLLAPTLPPPTIPFVFNLFVEINMNISDLGCERAPSWLLRLEPPPRPTSTVSDELFPGGEEEEME